MQILSSGRIDLNQNLFDLVPRNLFPRLYALPVDFELVTDNNRNEQSQNENDTYEVEENHKKAIDW